MKWYYVEKYFLKRSWFEKRKNFNENKKMQLNQIVLVKLQAKPECDRQIFPTFVIGCASEGIWGF